MVCNGGSLINVDSEALEVKLPYDILSYREEFFEATDLTPDLAGKLTPSMSANSFSNQRAHLDTRRSKGSIQKQDEGCTCAGMSLRLLFA
jgi:hypothetical protein